MVSTQASSGDAEIFIVDRKGDRHNLTYGATHRYAAPTYRRVGGGRVMGVGVRYLIDREHRDTDTLILRTKDQGYSSTSRTKATKLLSTGFNQPTQLFRVRNGDKTHSALEHKKDFIPFDAELLQDPGDNADDVDSGDERQTYRSIHGKAKTEDDVPSGFEAMPDSTAREQDDWIDLDADRKARNAQLSRAIDTHPTDVASWLRFIDHQDLLILGPGEESRALTYAERQSVADVKLALYEKALKKVGNNPQKDRLLLGRLQEGAQLWEIKKLLTQWKETLENNPNFISLWVKYLDFRQTDFQDFAFEQCMAIFVECLKLNASSVIGTHKVEVQCYLFLRLTLFLREAGYVELAVGLWQAVLEFTCFQPSSFAERGDEQGALSSFTDFWDSEVARIGEEGASGWRKGMSSEVDPVTHTYQCEVVSSELLETWAGAERERTLDCRLPSRSLDEFKPDMEDPYTVVLFSDLQGVLPLFWDLDSSDQLLDSFLYFCHLPHLTISHNASTTRLWSGDSFVRNEFVDNAQSGLSLWIPSKTDDDSQASVTPFSFPLPKYLHTTDTLFAAPESWFSSLQSWVSHTAGEASIINSDWVRRTLRALVELHTTDDELAEYLLAVEFACDRDGAKRFAKRLLKTRSSNLRLYNSYALMQSRAGAQSTANHVWSTALSMSTDFGDYDKVDCGLLWKSWLWEFIQCGDLTRASYVLQAMPLQRIDLDLFSTASEPVQFNATSMLRMQNFLHESQERALAYRKSQVYTAYTDCLAILLYITEHSYDAVLDVYASAVLKLRELPLEEENMKAFTAELLHQARARLIYFHIERKGKFKPSQIHDLLKESISLFPHNTIFQSLFMWNESRFPVFDRIRDIRDLTKSTDPDSRYQLDGPFGSTALTRQTVPISTHLFSIYNELCRPVFTGFTAHSARAAFEKAIGAHSSSTSLRPSEKHARHSFDIDSARSNLTIWKLYILFELNHTHDVRAAKAVFYRAIRACPWSKEIVMLAFEHLRYDLVQQSPRQRGLTPKNKPKEHGLGFDDLRQVYNVSIEKQLRVHLNIQSDIFEILAQRPGSSEAPHDSP